MGRRPTQGTKAKTRLAQWRVRRGVTQDEMIRATGLARTTYLRLEHGQIENPPVRFLANCAIALGCRLDDLLEDDHVGWTAFKPQAANPPSPTRFWRSTDSDSTDKPPQR